MDKNCRLMGLITQCCKLLDFLVVFPMRSRTRALLCAVRFISRPRWTQAKTGIEQSRSWNSPPMKKDRKHQKTLPNKPFPKWVLKRRDKALNIFFFQLVVSFLLFLVLMRFPRWKIHPISNLRPEGTMHRGNFETGEVSSDLPWSSWPNKFG